MGAMPFVGITQKHRGHGPLLQVGMPGRRGIPRQVNGPLP